SSAVGTTRDQMDSSTTLSGRGAPSSAGPPTILFANARTARLDPRASTSTPPILMAQPAACRSKAADGSTTRARISFVPSSAASRLVDGRAASQRAMTDCARASAFEIRGTRSHGNAEKLGGATKLVRFYPTSAYPIRGGRRARAPTWLPDPVRIDGHELRP